MRRLPCIRCGDAAPFESLAHPFGQGLCHSCFMTWLSHPLDTPGYRRFARWKKGMENHPTFKALTAALDALEAVPPGTLVDSEVP